MHISDKQPFLERVKSNAIGVLMATCCILMVFGSVPSIDLPFRSKSGNQTLALQGFGQTMLAHDTDGADGKHHVYYGTTCSGDVYAHINTTWLFSLGLVAASWGLLMLLLKIGKKLPGWLQAIAWVITALLALGGVIVGSVSFLESGKCKVIPLGDASEYL